MFFNWNELDDEDDGFDDSRAEVHYLYERRVCQFEWRGKFMNFVINELFL